MDIFEKMRERSPFISAVVKFQNGKIYPFVFALICAISACFGKEVYIPCITVLSLLTIFAGLFSSDLKVFIAPALMIYYSIGSDKPADFYENYYEIYYKEYTAKFLETLRTVPSFESNSLIFFVACLLVLVSVLIYKLIHSGVFAELFKKRGILFYSILAMDIAFIFNGVFSDHWSIAATLYGILCALVITLSYCMFYAIIKKSDDGISYACLALVAMALCIFSQTAITSCRLYVNDIIIAKHPPLKHINRALLDSAWGAITIADAAIACAIPAAMYLAHSKRLPALSYFCALIFFANSIFTNTRSAMIFGGIALFFGIIICCACGKNKKTNRLITLILIVGIIIFAVVVLTVSQKDIKTLLTDIASFLRVNFKLEENPVQEILGTRYHLWASGIKDFLRAPLFGVGFVSGDYELNRVYDHMYHNIVVEFLGSMGIVGIVAFLFHIVTIFAAALRKFSANRLLLLCVPICILGMSLFDNFFFYPNFNIIYGAFLACAEILSERKGELTLNE